MEHSLPPRHQVFMAGTGSQPPGRDSSVAETAPGSSVRPRGWEKPAGGASHFLARLRARKGQPSTLGWQGHSYTHCSSHQGTHLEKKGLRPTGTSSRLLGGHALGLAGLEELLSLHVCPLSVQTSSCKPSAGVRLARLQSSVSSYLLLKRTGYYQIICL